MDGTQNKEKVERAIARFNAGDIDGYLAMYAEDAAVHGMPPRVEGGHLINPAHPAVLGFVDELLAPR